MKNLPRLQGKLGKVAREYCRDLDPHRLRFGLQFDFGSVPRHSVVPLGIITASKIGRYKQLDTGLHDHWKESALVVNRLRACDRAVASVEPSVEFARARIARCLHEDVNALESFDE